MCYITGYLIKKLKVSHKCDTCGFNFSTIDVPDASRYSFLKQKTYKEVGCLIYATEDLCKVIDQIETRFRALFRLILPVKGVMLTLNSNAEEICTDCSLCCEHCQKVLNKMGKLYMAIRLHHQLDKFNKADTELRGNAKRNRKMMKLMHI